MDTLATAFVQAVNALHAPDVSASDRAQANAWLVAFAEESTAPPVCEALLQQSCADTSSIPEAALIFAAGVLAVAAAHAGTSSVPTLLELCAVLPSRPAVSRLAGAVATAAAAAAAEHSLIEAAAFRQLDQARQLIVLHGLAQALEQLASPEELLLRF